MHRGMRTRRSQQEFRVLTIIAVRVLCVFAASVVLAAGLSWIEGKS